ncbi:hypothetical protein [Yimella sp. cx-51]|uniref:hypothetical protein n=1 Tax=Yimella sp. cx-51 TaxID=2770551 RepID=UPI00165DC061|nr:hypothetical protein [Yimella sp. cx-51]MBC9957828.1 hypothetical protein [Yimella sp. cx-51]QTH37970.1 hypothetical protein J5M86_14220 [Yimella sp. cx-51]
MQWDSTETWDDYLERLAVANDVPVYELQRRSALLRERTSRCSAADIAPAVPRSQASLPPKTQTHPLIGHYDAVDGAPTWVLRSLPDNGAAIGRDIRATSWPWKRFDLLTELAQIVMPRLSDHWPNLAPVPEHILTDSTRTLPLEDWSLPVRGYALQTLWPHTDHGGYANHDMQRRTVIARDLLAAGRWLSAADDLNHEHPSLAVALRTAAHRWPSKVRPTAPAQIPFPAMHTFETAATGPFSVHAVGQFEPATLHTLYAATVARHALISTADPVSAWGRATLEDVADHLGPSDPRQSNTLRSRAAEPRPYAADACRMLATDEGVQVIRKVSSLSIGAPLAPDEARAWWASLSLPERVRRTLSSATRSLPSATVLDIVWIDLTGHLPDRLYWPGFPVALRAACWAFPGDDLLSLREWVSAHLQVPELTDHLHRRDHSRQNPQPDAEGSSA